MVVNRVSIAIIFALGVVTGFIFYAVGTAIDREAEKERWNAAVQEVHQSHVRVASWCDQVMLSCTCASDDPESCVIKLIGDRNIFAHKHDGEAP